jgi:type I restriction enzyme S subunit
MSELPEGWASTTLGELLPVSYGKALEQQARSADGTYRYIGSGGPIASTDERLTFGETIVIGRKGTAGSVQRFPQGCWPSDTTFYVEVPKQVSGQLVEHQLRFAQLAQHDRSTALPGLGRPDLESTVLAIPPRREQERIVAAIEEAFSKLDAGEAGLRTVHQLLKRMRDAILTAAVTGRLVPQDPTDTPARKLLADLGARSTAMVEAPTGWVLAELGDLLVDIEAGKSFATEGRPAAPGEVGVIKVSAMTWGHFLPSENKALPQGSVIDERWVIRRGDLLLSRANTAEYVGACVLVLQDHEDLILSDKSLRLKPSAGVDSRWLLHALRSRPTRDQIELLATGTKESMRNISQAKLRSLRVLVPPSAEQSRIAEEVERQFSFIDACERAVDAGLARSAALRRSVLKAAFEGRLVPQDPSDEAASVLLERIRAERAAAPGQQGKRKKKAEAS